jgi:aspartate/methionine/tyrosine aminotransferase
MLNADRLVSKRAKSLDASGIRRVFELGATLVNPIDLSIGQPDFPVPDEIRRAAVEAIEAGKNGYSMTTGVAPLRRRCAEHIAQDLGWPDGNKRPDDVMVSVTSGTSAALFLMNQALLDTPEDEIIIPDPYFVAYDPMARFAGGTAVRCETYPDFRMTADRIEPLITERTKAVLLNTPGNPTGVVLTQDECRDVLELCRSKGVLLISDEIYDEFTFEDAREDFPSGRKCPSPAREPGSHEDVLVIRGFGKTYGCTGWRMGYIAGPPWIVGQIAKLSQYSYVCAPTPFQHACIAAFDVDMEDQIAEYARRRQLVIDKLGAHTEVTTPGGAFYAFVKVPEKLNMTGQQFFEACVERNLLIIPGNVFSKRDTHVRISLASPIDRIEAGLEIIAELMAGAGVQTTTRTG